jgi:hypothetical protein
LLDSTQVRGVHQGLVMFSSNNQDRFPLPSLLDKDNTTLARAGRAKDTTGNIMSVLIYNGFFGPELCVSPAESNSMIRQMETYEYSNPKLAVNPGKALWDPAFSADFTRRTGNVSYAHLLPAGARLQDWSNTNAADQAVLGNRGPQIASAARDATGGLSPVMANKASNTLLIHGARETWEGNIAYNDNHVIFETTTMAPLAKAFATTSAPSTWADCFFFSEPDELSGRNAYLGIFTTAGETEGQFTSIWD